MNLRTLVTVYKNFWTRERILSFIKGVLLFIIALVLEGFADAYVSRLNGLSVDDLILSHIPAIDIDPVIIIAPLLLTFLILVLLILKPRYVNFTIKSLAVFIIVRSFFISLTHLGIDPHQLQFDTDSIGFGLYNILYNTKGDFFFSGHTGIPFLMALIFWDERMWRYVFLGASVLLGISVLLAHIHYSIDVFAAPFMAYGIFSISRFFFKESFESANG